MIEHDPVTDDKTVTGDKPVTDEKPVRDEKPAAGGEPAAGIAARHFMKSLAGAKRSGLWRPVDVLFGTVLLLIVIVGYQSGRICQAAMAHRTRHGAGQMAARSMGLHGNLARMLAFQLGAGDDELGMGDEAFPQTMDTYWIALNTIAAHFYNPTPLSLFTTTGRQVLAEPARFKKLLTYSAISGIMSSLDDKYSRFLDPASFKEMQQDNSGSFAGIGAQLIDKDGRIVILKALPDTPAARAGILPMDEIAAINGRSTDRMTSETAVTLIHGKPGTPVELTLKRGARLLTVKIIRAVIDSQHFESRVLDGDIGYMHLMMFDEPAADNIEKAMRKFQQQGVRGLILDLRDNPGGLLDAAINVASKFIPPGPVVWVQERAGQRTALLTNNDAHRGHHLPLVVLVNHYSASASEIVSGAVKDTHSGTLVGLTTWGKGLVQEVIPLNDNSAIALTTERYYTPSGTDINEKGVVPEVISGETVPEPDSPTAGELAALLKEKDAIDKTQLDTAVNILRKEIGQPVNVAKAPGR